MSGDGGRWIESIAALGRVSRLDCTVTTLSKVAITYLDEWCSGRHP